MAQRLMFWLHARGLLLTIALGVAGGYLLIAHRAHIGFILSYSVLVACPIMHFFMHRHGHGQGGKRHPPSAHKAGPRGRAEPPEPVFHEPRSHN